MELGGTCGLQFGQKMNTVEALKTDGARRKTTAGDMGILYFGKQANCIVPKLIIKVFRILFNKTMCEVK